VHRTGAKYLKGREAIVQMEPAMNGTIRSTKLGAAMALGAILPLLGASEGFARGRIRGGRM
jgi:hypothetical protein